MEYVTRGVCGQEGCRERRYFLDNGLWFCRRGHLQEVCRALPSLACSPHCDESQSGEIRLVLICEKLNVCVGPTSRRGSRRFWDSGSEAPSEEGEGGEVAKKYAMSLSLDSWPPSLISAKNSLPRSPGGNALLAVLPANSMETIPRLGPQPWVPQTI